MPPAFAEAGYTRLASRQDPSVRAVFHLDPLGRYVYILCDMEKELERAELTLEFAR
jgi:hypothetical protein